MNRIQKYLTYFFPLLFSFKKKVLLFYFVGENTWRLRAAKDTVYNEQRTIIYLEDWRDAVLSNLYLFILLPSHSTCFGCLPHPSSGVHKL